MAANYLPTKVPGETRRRARQIILNNHISKELSIEFFEEDNINLADGTRVTIPKGHFSLPVIPETLSQKIPDIDINTGQVMSEVSVAELFQKVQHYVSILYVYYSIRKDHNIPFYVNSEEATPTAPILTKTITTLDKITFDVFTTATHPNNAITASNDNIQILDMNNKKEVKELVTSGGTWKVENNMITYQPTTLISESIEYIILDNNSQASVPAKINITI